MDPIEDIVVRRMAVLSELEGLHSLHKGSLIEQWIPVVRAGRKTRDLRGPYLLRTTKVDNKTVSERIRGDLDVRHAKQDASNYKRFKDLCRELEDLTQQLGQAEREQAASQEAVKKGLKPRPRRASK